MGGSLMEAAPLVEGGAARYFFNDDTFTGSTPRYAKYSNQRC